MELVLHSTSGVGNGIWRYGDEAGFNELELNSMELELNFYSGTGLHELELNSMKMKLDSWNWKCGFHGTENELELDPIELELDSIEIKLDSVELQLNYMELEPGHNWAGSGLYVTAGFNRARNGLHGSGTRDYVGLKLDFMILKLDIKEREWNWNWIPPNSNKHYCFL